MSGSRAARAALALGLLALAAIPLGALVSALLEQVRLLTAELVAVPAALLLGLAAVAASRRARLRFERSVRRAGEGIVRAGRLAAFAGVYLAVTGAVALAFYGVLRASS